MDGGCDTYSVCSPISWPIKLACCAMVFKVPDIESIAWSCSRIIIYLLAGRKSLAPGENERYIIRGRYLLFLSCPSRLVIVPISGWEWWTGASAWNNCVKWRTGPRGLQKLRFRCRYENRRRHGCSHVLDLRKGKLLAVCCNGVP